MRPSRRFGVLLFVGLLASTIGVFLFLNSNTQATSEFNLAQATLLAGFIVFVVALLLYAGASITDHYYRKNDPRVKEAYEDERLLKELDDRSKSFLQISIPALYYGNHEEIDNIYSTYFGQDIVVSITSETSEETGGEISALFSQVFGIKQAGKDSTKVIKSYKPKEETTLNKFLKYQRAVILTKQINLGLEFVRVDFTEYNEYHNQLDWFINTYQINLNASSEELDRKSNELYDRGVEETLVQLERAKDLILMEEKFTISDHDESYDCSYLHPVSEYLSYKGVQLTIRFAIPKKDVHASNFDFSQVVGKVVPLRIFGKVILPVDRNSNNWEMLVKPIAVY